MSLWPTESVPHMSLKLTHWEYSFLLHTSNLGDNVRTATNPFTGETIESAIDNGLTQAEIDAVQDVFDQNGIDGPEPEGEGYAVYGSNGDHVRFRCRDLNDGLPITEIVVEIVVSQLSDEILQLLLQLARAGNLLLMSSAGDCVQIVDNKPNRRLQTRWPDIQTMSSNVNLKAWLQEVIGGRKVHVYS